MTYKPRIASYRKINCMQGGGIVKHFTVLAKNYTSLDGELLTWIPECGG